MAEEKTSNQRLKSPQSREDRLKAALKANLARRKAQGRARSAGENPSQGAHQVKDKE